MGRGKELPGECGKQPEFTSLTDLFMSFYPRKKVGMVATIVVRVFYSSGLLNEGCELPVFRFEGAFDRRQRLPSSRWGGLPIVDLVEPCQVFQVVGVFAHAFARSVADFGYRASVTGHHLDDDVERFVTKVVGQVGAYAETGIDPTPEMIVKLEDFVEGKPVAENQGFALWLDVEGFIEPDRPLAPGDRIAAVVAQAVIEVAEKQLEIPAEGFHGIAVGEGDSQAVAIFQQPG